MAGDAWITVQLGQEANCVGSQFWNSRYLSQNSSESPLFRETLQSSIVPRVVSFDWEPFNRNSTLVNNSTVEGLTWKGPLQKIGRNSGQNKRNAPQVPICNLNSNSLIKCPSTVKSIQHFSQGVEVYKEKLGEEFLEHIRKELECCDQLRGFQVILDSYCGLCGFASELLYGLKDEFRCKVPFILFGCGSENSSVEPIPVKAFNEAKLLGSLVDNEVHYVPLHFRKVRNLSDRTRDIWQDWAPDLEECKTHGRGCTLSAVAIDCFYSLFIAPDAAPTNAILKEVLQPNRYSSMSWISLLPLVVSTNKSHKKWQLQTLITQGFRQRQSPPLYSVDWISQNYTSEEDNTTNTDNAMWIIRGTRWSESIVDDIQGTTSTCFSSSNIKQMLLDATGHKEDSVIRMEPFGFRRVVCANNTPNEVDSTEPALFSEAYPLDVVGEVSCNRIWNSRYYDMAIFQLKKPRNRYYSKQLYIDDDEEMERLENAKEMWSLK